MTLLTLFMKIPKRIKSQIIAMPVVKQVIPARAVARIEPTMPDPSAIRKEMNPKTVAIGCSTMTRVRISALLPDLWPRKTPVPLPRRASEGR